MLPEKSQEKPVVGIIEADKYIAEMLSVILSQENYPTASEELSAIKHNPRNYLRFLRRFDPRIIIWDIPWPYEGNWIFANDLRNYPQSRNRAFVYTTTNKDALEKLVGSTDAIAKPFSVDVIVEAVNRSHAYLIENP